MIYDIPGVFTSVIDRSYVQPLITEGRSILIAGFSKFGEDKFYQFGDTATMEFVLGTMDVERYGLGLMYGLGALTKTRHVIFKRLMPSDAAYANLIYMSDGTTRTKEDLNEPNFLKGLIDADQGVSKTRLVAKEKEVTAYAGQKVDLWEYNPDNISVYIGGLELKKSEYTAVDGNTIHFHTPLIEDRIINMYTAEDSEADEAAADDKITFINYEFTATGDVTSISIPGGYKNELGNVVKLGISYNGLDLYEKDYTATDGTNVIFHLGGQPGNGLIDDDFVVVHGVIDNTDYHNQLEITETIVSTTTEINSLRYPNGYNPEITKLSVNGALLGHSDYKAEDGENITFSNPLHDKDVVRLHSIQPGGSLNMWGALIAKGAGSGYNDLFVQFRPAYDAERQFTDIDGDIKYKFNFLKAVIYEQTPAGKRTVSEEFTVSLLENDPTSGMPIVGSITGEHLYINEKFKDSNEYLEFYLNESIIPELSKELNIDELTSDPISGEEGVNRFILKHQINNQTFEKKELNIEFFVGTSGKIEFRAVPIEGKEKIYTYYTNPMTGITSQYSISLVEDEIVIRKEGTTGNVLDTIYIDGYDSFYEMFLYDENGGSGPEKIILKTRPYKNMRQKFFDILTTESEDALWQMQSGSDGLHLIIDGKLNMGPASKRYGEEDTAGIYRQNAKQLLLHFYDTDETIHEVLYPELDFDYVPDWTSDMDIQASIIKFADEIGFTMPIISLPRVNAPDKDYKQRVEELYMSSFNTMIYSGQNNDAHYLSTNGKIISCPNSYYAMQVHLDVDNNISITEPAANVVKGQLPVAGVKLSYIAKSKDIEKLRRVQINTIIKETDGIYFIDQLTSYKAASKLTRSNVVKPIHRMRKDLPRLLKDLLQHKATTNIINDAQFRTERYMARWQVQEDNLVDGIFEEIKVTPVFVQEELKLIISIAVTPIGTIEKIEIPITVY